MANKTYGIFPGAIIGLNSDTIPSTFYTCNGSNGTPDTRDKMIIGAGATYALGATGGANTHTHNCSGGGGGGTLFGAPPQYFKDYVPDGNYGLGGSATSSGCTFDNISAALPPFLALNFIQARFIGAVPPNSIAWWTRTTGNIPLGWSFFNYDGFFIGAGTTYSRGDTGGATTHSHTASYGLVTGTFTLASGGVLKSGSGYLAIDSWTGGALSNVGTLLPLFYGLIPIISDGTRGIYSGMVLAYNGNPANLPAEYSVLTATYDRFVIGAGNLYSVNTNGGSNLAHIHSATWGGTIVLNAGTGILSESGATYMGRYGSILGSYSTVSMASSRPAYVALYYVIAN